MEYESLSAQIVTLKLVNTKFKARITELEARLKEAENELAEAKAQWASPVYARLEKAEARAEAAEKRSATLAVQLSEEYRDWMKEQCNEECRYGERLYANKYDEAKRLRRALEPIVNLMVSMRSLGYFTNDEWQSRLTAAQAALAAEQADGEKGVKG